MSPTAFDVGELRGFLRLDDSQYNRAMKAAPGTAQTASAATAKAMVGAEQAADKVAAAAGRADKAFRAFAVGKIGGEKLRELEALGVSTRQYIDAVTGVPGAQDKVRAALKATIPDADKLAAELGDLDKATGAATKRTQDLEAKQRALGTTATTAGRRVNQAATETKKAAEGFGLAGKAFGALAGFFAAGKIVNYVQESITAASSLNQTIGKSQTIFGSAAGAIEQWAGTAVDSVGLSKAAALDAAAGFGNMFTQLGYTSGAAADMSKQVLKLAADQGAFNNLPTGAVLDKLSAAFRGEYDSLQALIPNINAARVEQEALATTGKTATSALTAQEKAAATLAIVMKDGAAANGRFAAESGTLEGQTQRLTARVEEQKAALGEKLLPVALTVMQIFSDVGVPALGAFADILGVAASVAEPFIKALGLILTGFMSLPAPLQVALVAMTAVTLLRDPLGKLGDGMTGLTGKAKNLGNALKAAFISNPIGLAITAIATAFSIFSSSSDKAEAKAADLKTKVDAVTESLDKNTAAATMNTREWIRKDLGSRLDDFEKLGVTTKQVTDAMLGNADAAKIVQDAIQKSAEAAVEATGEYKGMEGRLRDAGVSMRDVAAAALNQDWTGVNAQIRDYNAGLEAGQQPISIISAEMKGLEGAVAGTRQNYNDLNGITGIIVTSQGNLAAAAKDAGTSLRDAKAPASELAGVFDDGKVAADELAKQVDAVMLAVDKMKGRNGDAEAAQRALNDTIRTYADSVRGIPEAERAVADAQDAVTEARAKATEAQGKAIDKNYTQEQKNRDVAAAARDLAGAQADLTAAQQDVGEATDTAAEKAADMRRAMAEAGQTALDSALAQGDVAGASDAAAKAMQGVRQSFIDMQSPADIASGKADAAADALGLIPGDYTANINANAEGAKATIGDVNTTLTTLGDRVVTVTVKARYDAMLDKLANGQGLSSSDFEGIPRAAGGSITGGIPGRDSVPVLAMPGEHMLTVSDVRAMGGQSGVYAFRQALHSPKSVTLTLPSTATAATATAGADLGPLMQKLIDLLQEPRTVNHNQFTSTSGQSIAEQLQEYAAIRGTGPFG